MCVDDVNICHLLYQLQDAVAEFVFGLFFLSNYTLCASTVFFVVVFCVLEVVVATKSLRTLQIPVVWSSSVFFYPNACYAIEVGRRSSVGLTGQLV